DSRRAEQRSRTTEKSVQAASWQRYPRNLACSGCGGAGRGRSGGRTGSGRVHKGDAMTHRTRSSLVLSAALLAALSAGACGRAAGPTEGQATPVATPPPVAVKTAPATRGNIQQVLSYTGDVKSSASFQIMPKISGRIEKLTVDVGSRVNAGDVIAELDKASLQAAVDQNQAALAAAEAKLASMKAGPRPEDVATAQRAVEVAQAGVKVAQAKLDQAASPARSDAIAAAQAALDQLKTKLEETAAGAKPEDIAALQAGVDQAAAQVDAAQKAVDNATATIASAQAQVDSALAGVTKAQAALDDAKLRQQQAANGQGGPGIRQEDIDNAQRNVDAAWAAWQNLLHSPTPEQIAVAKAAVATAEDQVTVAEKNVSAIKKGKIPGDSKVAKAQVDLAEVLAGPTQDQKNQAEAAFHAAEALRDKLKTGGTSDASALQLATTTADQALQQAKATYNQMLAVLQQSQIAKQTAEANLAAAQAAQAAAQARLDSARNPNPYDVQAAQQQVAQAQAQLDQLRNPDPFAKEQAQAALEQAQQQVAQAQAQLDSVMHPFRDEDIQAQQAQVDQARAALEAAQVTLDEAEVRAPVGGVVSEKNASEGALVGPSTPIVTLVPPGLELDVPVEESNLAQVQPNQPVNVTVAAYPGQTFSGTVETVSPTVDPKSRTVQVKVALNDPQNLLRPGMFAQLGIITQTKQDAVLVPRSAVVGRGTEPAVFVVKDGKAIRTPVKLGISNADSYEVVEGVQPGDQIVVTGQSELTNGDTVVATAATS